VIFSISLLLAANICTHRAGFLANLPERRGTPGGLQIPGGNGPALPARSLNEYSGIYGRFYHIVAVNPGVANE
jgi:hypothetical protein